MEGKQDALVILINRDEADGQINLIDAAIDVGITHIIPSAFGFTTTHPEIRKYPVLAAKAKMEDHLIQKASEGLCTYTQVQTGSFFDWALDRGIFLNTTKPDAPTMVFDGGDIPFSVTNMDDIGKAVASSLLNFEKVKNRDVHVHTAVVTQNQLLAYAKEAAPDREFKVVNLDTAELEKKAWENYNKGDMSLENMRLFLVRALFSNRVSLFKETDNDLLGLANWSNQQVKELVASYFK